MLAMTAVAESGKPLPVTTRPLSELWVYPRHEAPASVISLNPSLLSAEVSAPVRVIPVEVGEVVEPGTVLVELDGRDHELALLQAEAAVAAAGARAAQAQSQLKRAREVFAKGRFVSEDIVDQREMEQRVASAELQQATAAEAVARRQLDKCVVRAPFRAVIVQRRIHVGELAMPGAALIELIDLDRVQVSAAVQVGDAASLTAGTVVQLVTASERYPLALLRVSPAVQTGSRSREARFAFTGTPAAVGSEGRVVWQGTQAQLPPHWISRREQGLGVFVREAGKARFVPLPDAEEGRPASIDLPAGTAVIDEGRFGLQHGQPVTED